MLSFIYLLYKSHITMKRNLKTILLSFIAVPLYSQIGINTEKPNAAFQIVGKPTQKNFVDGFIPPMISKQDLASKLADTYSSNQIGTIVYVSDVSTPTGTTPSLSQTDYITSVGYYYFNGNNWQKLSPDTSLLDSTNDAWLNDPTNSRVMLSSRANGTARDSKNDISVHDNGRIGIGIGNETPDAGLHIRGENDGWKDDIRLDSYSGSSSTPAANFRFLASKGTAAEPLDISSGNTIGQINFHGRIGGTNSFPSLSRIWSSYTGDGTTEKSSLSFSVNGAQNSSLVITSDENVGISTSSPRTKLDVNGIISSREQTQTVSGTSTTITSINQSLLSLTGSPTSQFTVTLPNGVAGQRLTIINNTTGGYTARVNTNYYVQGSQAVDFIYTNNQWTAIGQSINDNINRIYTGEVIIPPHSATTTNTTYDNADWKLVTLQSGRGTSTTGTYSNISTFGTEIRTAGKVLVYEYQGNPFNVSKLYPILTAGNKLSGQFTDADTFIPNFVKLENINGKTRLTVVLARVDYISGATVASNANWQGTFFMNVMLVETK